VEKESTGLTRELSDHITAQLSFQRSLKTGGCFRLDACYEAGIRIEAEDESRPHEICLGCNKPRGLPSPSHLSEPMAVALRLDRLKDAGARFDYPDGLTAAEWACLDALQTARRADQEAEARQRAQDAEMQQRMAELNRARGVRSQR